MEVRVRAASRGKDMYTNEYEEPGTAHELARRLDAKQSGRSDGRLAAHPTAVEASRSTIGRGGKALVHCFGGCTQDEVLDALRDLGLWPRRAERSPRPKRLLRPVPNRQQHDAADRAYRAEQLTRHGGCTDAAWKVAALWSGRISAAGALMNLPRRPFASCRRESQATIPR